LNLFEPKVIFKKSQDLVSLKSELEEAIEEEKDELAFINQTNDLHELNHGNKYIYLKLVNNCLIIKSKNEDNLFYLKFKRKSNESKLIQLNKQTFKYMTNLVDYYQNDDSIFLLFDFKKNGKLFDYCRNLGDKLSSYQLKLYLAQILCALEEIHSKKIICKDLKIDNILVDDNKNSICLTYFCNNTLVEQTVDQKAFEFKYTAPGILKISQLRIEITK
jgi:serine/threonine protein kinase